MDALDRYLTAVRRNLFATAEEADRLAADLEAHFEAAVDGGEEPRRVLEDLGPPEEVAAAFNEGREVHQAGFWLRLVAFVGDFGAIVALCLPAVGLAVWMLTRATPAEIPAAMPMEMPIEIPGAGASWREVLTLATAGGAILGILVLYFPLLEARFGKTLGKHLMRLRVVRENGSPIGFGQALVRRLSLYFELLVVDALFIPFTDRRQRALDIIAKTIVAREPGEEAPLWGYVACLALPLIAIASLAGLAVLCAPT